MATEATTTAATTTLPADPIVDEVRARYAAAARNVLERKPIADGASCCTSDGPVVFGKLLYGAADRASLPNSADRIRAVDLPRPLAAPSATALPVVAESGCCGGSGCC